MSGLRSLWFLAVALTVGLGSPLSAQNDDVGPAFAAPMLDGSKLPERFPSGTVGALLLEQLELVVAQGKALPTVLTVEVQSREGASLAKTRGPVLDLAAFVGGPIVPNTDAYLNLPVAAMLPGGPGPAAIVQQFQTLPLFASGTLLNARIGRTSVNPTTEVVDREDLAWPVEAGDDAKLLLLHILPDFSLPPNVRMPEVGGGFSVSAITLVIYPWPAES